MRMYTSKKCAVLCSAIGMKRLVPFSPTTALRTRDTPHRQPDPLPSAAHLLDTIAVIGLAWCAVVLGGELAVP